MLSCAATVVDDVAAGDVLTAGAFAAGAFAAGTVAGNVLVGSAAAGSAAASGMVPVGTLGGAGACSCGGDCCCLTLRTFGGVARSDGEDAL